MVFSRSNLMDIFVTERKEKKKPVCLPSFYNSPSFWLGLNEGNLTFYKGDMQLIVVSIPTRCTLFAIYSHAIINGGKINSLNDQLAR